ncbi:Gfo/Idh/MocA family protein [Tunturibacter empetritectus]|nr:Gfo/Idh/MocA family oxidoreductase [Edaphobacter lichenicola]
MNVPLEQPEISTTMRPDKPRPIVILGAGGIVRDAHLPAYRKAKWPVIGIADVFEERAAQLQAEYQINRSFGSIAEAVAFAPEDAVYDLAVPASSILESLKFLPDGAAVLMQKPMGETLVEAIDILHLCRKKRLTAAVNFQLRWSPNLLKAGELMNSGAIGFIHDFELQVSCRMPWENWEFLASASRLEVLYHSIHYLDLARAWLGEPRSVYAKTVRSPRSPRLAATKSVIALDYGDWVRSYIATDHSNAYGPDHQRSFVQIEGTKGAVHAQIGGNLDYPNGLPDTLDFAPEGGSWRRLAIGGNWFPDAFVGSMGSLQSFLEGSSDVLPTSVEDAIHTMALVEAVYESSDAGGTQIPLSSTS